MHILTLHLGVMLIKPLWHCSIKGKKKAYFHPSIYLSIKSSSIYPSNHFSMKRLFLTGLAGFAGACPGSTSAWRVEPPKCAQRKQHRYWHSLMHREFTVKGDIQMDGNERRRINKGGFGATYCVNHFSIPGISPSNLCASWMRLTGPDKTGAATHKAMWGSR